MKLLQHVRNQSTWLIDFLNNDDSKSKSNHSINSITFTSKFETSKNSESNFVLNEESIPVDDSIGLSRQLNFKSYPESTAIRTIENTSVSKPTAKKPKLIRVTTVPGSLRTLLKGQLRFMDQYFKVTAIAGNTKSLASVRNEEDINTHGINMTRTITPFKDLIATYKLYKYFKKEQPFIVHTHTPKAGTLGMIAAKLAGVPHRLHTVAGLPLLESKGAKRWLLNLVEKLTYACATKILPNSSGLKEIIIQNKFTKIPKIKVIGNGSSNGIDTSYYNIKNISGSKVHALSSELNITKNDTVFLFIGRIVKDKGINELIGAFDKLSKQFENLKLILVGGRESHLDPLSDTTEALIQTNTNILEMGWQTDIRQFIAVSHILAHPSYREGFPNVVLQASSMGLPCIVSDINGCNEIIEQNINGIIVPPKDSKSLELAMKFMIDNPNKRKEMKANSRIRIIERYQQEYVWNELLKFYKTLK